MNQKVCGRFAPTPSGRLHLGNAMCFLLAWLQARSSGGRICLRIEDLDLARCPHSRQTAQQIEDDLIWLGLDWDHEADQVIRQSERTNCYLEEFEKLTQNRLVYPCFCSRSQLQVAVAPHHLETAPVYSGRCRNLSPQEIDSKKKNKRPAFRLLVPNETICFNDGVYGKVSQNLSEDCGDFIVRRADGVFAYQFAVVVDDALMGVNQVVRGRDLLSSTPRQLLLYRLLGFDAPDFYHVPLLLDSNGAKLSKRNQSISIAWLKQRCRPEQVVGLLAGLCRLTDSYRPVAPKQLLAGFDIQKIPKEDIRLPSCFYEKFQQLTV